MKLKKIVQLESKKKLSRDQHVAKYFYKFKVKVTLFVVELTKLDIDFDCDFDGDIEFSDSFIVGFNKTELFEAVNVDMLF